MNEINNESARRPYQGFFSPPLHQLLFDESAPHPLLAGLRVLPDVAAESHPSREIIESPEALRFILELYQKLRTPLASLLAQRRADRRWIDRETAALSAENRVLNRSIEGVRYRSVIGQRDRTGRIPIGPLRADFDRARAEDEDPERYRVAPLPTHLQGQHATLFGPPDTAKMAINAMNAIHRALPGEPALVTELVEASTLAPKWGADDED